jgi:hypothetical protein
MLPGAQIDAWHVRVAPQPTDPSELAALLPSYDIVVTQISEGMGADEVAYNRLQTSLANVVFLPSITFLGLHPDLTYISTINGPLGGVLHSEIVAAGFLAGLSVKRVSKLFNAYIYAKLGYFDAFEQGKAAFLKNFSEHGFDMSAHFERWYESGPFMYTFNHPSIRVLASFAEVLLHRLNIPISASNSAIYSDYLSSHVTWPVYPELADHYKISGGSLRFLKSKDILHEEGDTREITLDDMVEKSYRAFQNSRNSLQPDWKIQKACEIISAVVRRP